MMRRRALLANAAALGGLAACATPKPKVIGNQIPVLPDTGALAVADNAPPVTVPPATALADWPQVLAGPGHAPGNVAGPVSLNANWHVTIGAPGGFRQNLPTTPVIAQGRIFTMDAAGAISAFSAHDGAAVWHRPTRPRHVTTYDIGGGLTYDSGTLYASTGYAQLLAIDPDTGAVRWRVALDYPARSAPTVAGGLVAVVTQNDLLLTFDPASGTPGWRFLGQISSSPTSVAATGAPAYDSGILVAGFASGILAALDVNSGTPVWEQSLASSFGQSSPLDFSDIVAAPVIANGVVYAVSLGNTAQAIDLHSGTKVWSHDATSLQGFTVAGGFGFLVDIQQRLSAINLDDGLVSWMTQLPNVRHMEHHTGAQQSWAGPLMMNGQLLLTSNLGTLIGVDAVTGTAGPVMKLAGPADLPPVCAGGALYVLTRNAILTAYS